MDHLERVVDWLLSRVAVPEAALLSLLEECSTCHRYLFEDYPTQQDVDLVGSTLLDDLRKQIHELFTRGVIVRVEEEGCVYIENYNPRSTRQAQMRKTDGLLL